MLRKIGLLCVLFVLVTALSGCITTRKRHDLEMQGLRNQISALQTQMQYKDQEINNLQDELNKAQSEKQEIQQQAMPEVKVSEFKSRPSVKAIQKALKNAGYTPGTIDGKMGKQTREAIRAFQKANNLKVDGKVGKKTWEVLKEYSNKKVK
jgi:peptidoglycan hydrolase-like protein with peptidoglycan-binding domain